MRRLYLISILVYAAAVLAQGQVIDTSKNINTWMLKHNYTRFEDVPLDTNTHQIQHDYNLLFFRDSLMNRWASLGMG